MTIFLDPVFEPADSTAMCEQRNEGLGRAFQRKALRPDELLVNELLEKLGVGKLGQNVDLLVARQLYLVLEASIRSCNHIFSLMSSMCMYCTPIEPQ